MLLVVLVRRTIKSITVTHFFLWISKRIEWMAMDQTVSRYKLRGRHPIFLNIWLQADSAMLPVQLYHIAARFSFCRSPLHLNLFFEVLSLTSSHISFCQNEDSFDRANLKRSELLDYY